MKLKVWILMALAACACSAQAQQHFTVEQEGENLRLVFNQTLSFAMGSAELSDESAAAIDDVVDYLKSKSVASLKVEGHTDNSTFSKTNTSVLANNWSLSAARASVVVRALVDAGMPANKLSAVGMADTSPRASNSSAGGRKLNRRIEMLVEMTPVEADPKQLIMAKLKRARPDLSFHEVLESDVPGLYEVRFNEGGLIYATSTGDNFVVGEIYAIENGTIVNLTEKQRSEERMKVVGRLDREQMIRFVPEGDVKSEIYIFTDVDCTYCRLLHREVPKLTAMGVQVNYLAFPRSGMGSPVAQKMVSAWCADDPSQAMTTLKSGGEIRNDQCAGNPVQAQYELGQRIGVTATPALLFSDGELVLGYMAADQLAERLGIN
jgi:thiol:disulfide interchange protein DsbC